MEKEIEDEWVKQAIEKIRRLAGETETKGTDWRDYFKPHPLESARTDQYRKNVFDRGRVEAVTIYRCKNCAFATDDLSNYVTHVVEETIALRRRTIPPQVTSPPAETHYEYREKEKTKHTHIPIGEHLPIGAVESLMPAGGKPNLCPKCGKKLERDIIDDYLYCPKCGTRPD